MNRIRLLLLILSAAFLSFYMLGCDDSCPVPSGDGPLVHFTPKSTASDENAVSWLRFPFPAKHRVTATGAPRFSDFPNPKQVGLLEDYISLLEAEMSGFSVTSGIYLSFDAAINPESLPQIAAESRSENSPIHLVDITPNSPEYGVRRPLRWEYWDNATEYLAPHTLAVAPTWGMPLREATTYAFYVTTDLQGANGSAAESPALLQYLLSDSVAKSCATESTPKDMVDLLKEQFAPLAALLKNEGIRPNKIAAATVFTTGNHSLDLKQVYDQVQQAPAPTLTSNWKTFEAEEGEAAGSGLPYQERTFKWRPSPIQTVDYYVFETSFASPNYQHGTVPYSQGGGFQFDENGPVLARTETLRAVLTVPKLPPSDGRCYPVTQYAHGTGGDAYSFVENGSGGRLAGRGYAGISLDQPLHGDRSEGKTFSVDVASFNFANAQAARSNFRQSAVDTFSLTRMLKAGITIPDFISPTGEDICFRQDRIAFFGHSQGGLSGSIAMAYENNIDSWVLSGAGGGLSITILERKDLVDFEALMSFLLQLDPAETLSELHPTMMIIQSGVDVTDPITYAPYWIDRGDYSGPHDILLTSGESDAQTPHQTATALAVAGRIPLVNPQMLPIWQYSLLGVDPVDAPVSKNIDSEHTAGFLQWSNEASFADSHVNHFLIFNSPEAINASMNFLRTARIRDAPVIERVPDANVR